MKNGKHVEEAGITCWYKDDLLHREDGPAVEGQNGCVKEWWVNGVRHRLDGPAIEWLASLDNPSDFDVRQWLIEGKQYTEEDFNEYIKRKTLSGKLQGELEEKQTNPKLKI